MLRIFSFPPSPSSRLTLSLARRRSRRIRTKIAVRLRMIAVSVLQEGSCRKSYPGTERKRAPFSQPSLLPPHGRLALYSYFSKGIPSCQLFLPLPGSGCCWADWSFSPRRLCRWFVVSCDPSPWTISLDSSPGRGRSR
jgi:hypothetical protein